MRVVGFVFTLGCAQAVFASGVWKMTWSDYQDRVQAAWTAQIVATLMGLPFEGRVSSSRQVWVTGYPARGPRSPLELGWAPVDDDYYYELVALRAFERYGPHMSLDELGEQWKENSAGSWGSSEQTRWLLARGIPGSQTGHPRYNRWWWTIGPQFSADLYGMIAPGDPNLAAQLASRYGRINGHAEAVDGAVFIAGMVSLAFREKDPRQIVREAARLIPASSPYRQCLNLMLALAEEGRSEVDVLQAIQDRWRFEYPAINNAVANGGLVAASVWFGEGDFLKTVNVAFRAGDFSDADCNAANAAAVVGAMHGMKGLPASLVEVLNDRIRGAEMGGVQLTPPVDERISDIAHRIAALGRKILAANGHKAGKELLEVTYQPAREYSGERFQLADLMQLWNPDWRLERAGFGGYRGTNCTRLTYLDGEILATWPRDESRGLVLRRTLRLPTNARLELEVGADKGCAWHLDVFVDNSQVFTTLVEGAGQARSWQTVQVDLTEFAGREVEIRLIQRTLIPGRIAGNAYWRNLRVR
ncbi:MAG: ADP-ribosylglycohydrolase family protein [Bryobacterales bacterium]|nr:ADP-ribosylglycohydrolase family protein [Bryobacteraceae bacterium]MDW8354838.1 ADP-ribosylglycohydrolase family protein [Bryobacterales bacterium]